MADSPAIQNDDVKGFFLTHNNAYNISLGRKQ